jgi:hypothetical protein
MSVSMASGRKMEFISARVSGKSEGMGIGDGDWEKLMKVSWLRR